MRLKVILCIAVCGIISPYSPRSNAQDFRQAIRTSTFAETTEAMGTLIRLAEFDGHLRILQEWSPKSDICKEVASFQKRGFKLKRARKYAREEVTRERLTLRHAYRDVIDQSRVPFDEREPDFLKRQALRGFFSNFPFGYSIQFHDDIAGIDVAFHESRNGEFVFCLRTPDTCIDLHQSADQIRLAVIEGNETSVVAAENFKLLIKTHPAEVVMKLLPAWRALGIKRPISFSDSEVVSNAISRLASSKDKAEITKLLRKLDSESIEERDAAQTTLAEQSYRWEHLLRDYSAELKLGADANERIEDIIKYSRLTPNQLFVRSIDLNDPQTLIRLWSNTPEEHHQLIINRLESVVGKFLGNSLEEWESGLEIWKAPKSRTSRNLIEAIAQSELSKIAIPMSENVHLTATDDQLGIFDDWEILRKRQQTYRSREERLQELIDRFTASGVDEADVEELAERSLDQMLNRDRQLSSNLAFESFRKPFMNEDRHEKLVGNSQEGETLLFFDQDLLADLSSSYSNLYMRFHDLEAEVSLRLENNVEKGRFWMRIAAPGQLIDVTGARRKFRLTVIRDGKADVYLAKSFRQFVNKYPNAYKDILLPTWTALGFQQPLSPYNPKVTAAAVKKIKAAETDEMIVIDLLNQLNSQRIKERNDAEAQLMNNFHCWDELIEKYRHEIELDPEAKNQLDKVRETSPGTPAQDYVNQLDLLDAKILVLIWEHAPPRSDKFIIRQLELATGESAGDTIQAWKELIRSKEPLFID